MGSEIVDILRESVAAEWVRLVGLTPRLAVALVVVVLFVLAGRLLGRGMVRVLTRGKLPATHVAFFRGLVVWAVALVGLLVALNVLGLQGAAAGLLAGGGITAVALGFAFRGIGENLLAGLFLAFSRPFERGHLIQSNSFVGEVRGIELRHTHIRTADGKDVFIPSSQIFNEPLVNFTRDGLRRGSFVIGIDYADDTSAARRALADKTSRVGGVLPEPKPAASVSAMTPNYVELEVSFWVNVFERGVSLVAVRSAVMEACRLALMEAGFTFSSSVSTNIDLSVGAPVGVRLDRGEAGSTAG
ncbi:MAG: mechanosensitive ion channel family protein [Acidobacteriota bacterium]|nr:mechanosensitive ion channel family protein [Acidobacteriota bacterium]